MPPHLHPRSQSTNALFAGTLLASLLVVGIPHVFPCPAPRRTFADSEMIIGPDGQQIQRVRRRRKDVGAMTQEENLLRPSSTSAEDEISTFLQLEEESKQFSKTGRECPVPKPTGILGDMLGLSDRTPAQPSQGEGRQADFGCQRTQ
ncbi:uncharacterized protein BDV17DRAFT_255861 [Aspergillus undulatus]|uniref:uncharacterized protein n=1 Tax=Aspergillus undulatus TaxID=1810928 RepID=UPI003CCD477E